MKKTKFSIAALTVLLAMGSVGVFAAEGDEYRKAETPVEFELQKGTVVDPELPEVTDPKDPNPGAQTDFRIWYVPQKFQFSAGKLSTTAESYDKTGDFVTKVAVADIRDERDGWNLGASLSVLKNSVTDNPLIGATVEWDQEVKEIADPTQISEYSDSDVEAQDHIIVNNEIITVMKAEAGKGFGYHNATLSNIKLNVPAKQGEIGDYTGTVNWSLTKTPTVQE